MTKNEEIDLEIRNQAVRLYTRSVWPSLSSR